VLALHEVTKLFPVRSTVTRRTIGQVRAVDGVSLQVARGETVGLVGESGSGKSTIGRLALRLLDPTGGTISLAGTDVTTLSRRRMRPIRRHGQMVFQDPYSSLDPTARIAESIEEPLRVHDQASRAGRRERVVELLSEVNLASDRAHRYPHEFSGGQLQRVALARALAVRPQFIVADEAVSSLDVSTQAQILQLMKRLQDEHGVAYLFISHDLSVVRNISDRIAVMYLGQLVEVGPAADVTTSPCHPYTQALLSAVPEPDPEVQRSRPRIVLAGDIPSAMHAPSGCRFHPRCPYAMDICREVDPAPVPRAGGGEVRCHLHTTGPRLAGASVDVLAGAPAST